MVSLQLRRRSKKWLHRMGHRNVLTIALAIGEPVNVGQVRGSLQRNQRKKIGGVDLSPRFRLAVTAAIELNQLSVGVPSGGHGAPHGNGSKGGSKGNWHKGRVVRSAAIAIIGVAIRDCQRLRARP